MWIPLSGRPRRIERRHSHLVSILRPTNSEGRTFESFRACPSGARSRRSTKGRRLGRAQPFPSLRHNVAWPVPTLAWIGALFAGSEIF